MENLETKLKRLADTAQKKGWEVSIKTFASGTIYFKAIRPYVEYGFWFYGYDEFNRNPETLKDLQGFIKEGVLS